jgi:acetyl-CoA/propionyl-CoA carboxylase biotin carboxyl carrier protein
VDLFQTVLVANRGEIACRVIRTLRSLGIRSVAVYSDADAGARHVLEADDAVRLGPAAPAASYLNIEAILDACRRTGAQAVHPGYGFLSENEAFAHALSKEGITFIGPTVRALNIMGDKIRSKNHVVAHGVPVIPGVAQPGLSDAQLLDAAAGVGYPLLVKPSAGGGGKGMQVVEDPSGLGVALQAARRIAASAFGDDTLFLERLVRAPRHIEVQVLADTHGSVIHLGERECSLQRRHQKVIEEAPSPLLDAATRERIGEAACAAARSVDYVGAGTVEFLVADQAPDEFFFMEMNTRLQVEHPVTELVTGVDLVEWQIRIAAGEALRLAQEDITLTGHAVEARVYAEDPEAGFLPSAGTVLALREPEGEGIRVDSGLLPGLEVSPIYDPMLAKVIAWAPTREQSLERLDRALAGTTVAGLHTNIEYLRLLLADRDVRAGRLSTTLIERKLPGFGFRKPSDAELAAAAAVLAWAATPGAPGPEVPLGPHNGIPPWQRDDGWRIGGTPAATRVELAVDGHTVRSLVRARARGHGCTVSMDGPDTSGVSVTVTTVPEGDGAAYLRAVVDGVRLGSRLLRDGNRLWFLEEGWSAAVRRRSRAEIIEAQRASLARSEGTADPEVRTPMPGTVVTVQVSDGEAVAPGQVLLTIEAMKMEHQLAAAVAGTVELNLAPGDLVSANQVVARIHPSTTEGPTP